VETINPFAPRGRISPGLSNWVDVTSSIDYSCQWAYVVVVDIVGDDNVPDAD